jgi:hypothetical protein
MWSAGSNKHQGMMTSSAELLDKSESSRDAGAATPPVQPRAIAAQVRLGFILLWLLMITATRPTGAGTQTAIRYSGSMSPIFRWGLVFLFERLMP